MAGGHPGELAACSGYPRFVCVLLLLLFCLDVMSTFCDPVDCSTPGSSVLHYLPEFAQIHVH